MATTPPSKVLLYKTEFVPPTAIAIALVRVFLAIGHMSVVAFVHGYDPVG